MLELYNLPETRISNMKRKTLDKSKSDDSEAVENKRGNCETEEYKSNNDDGEQKNVTKIEECLSKNLLMNCFLYMVKKLDEI